MSINPDPALTLEATLVPCRDPHVFCGVYSTPVLTRVHLNSMARLRLSYESGVLSSDFPPDYGHNDAWDQYISEGHLILRPCVSDSRSLPPSLPRVQNYFTPADNVLFDYSHKEPMSIRVIASKQARLLVWRWWEPKF
ncbi:hypothetical protein RSAG8_07097, partial [Rhizoctonia solani AG-8 WAC10335]